MPPGATESARVRSAASWSGSCMIPKHPSTTTSACPPSGTGTNPCGTSGSSQVPPCGLGYSVTVPPAGSTPAATTAATASRRCSVSAAGSRPSGSSATMTSSASCASPQPPHSHIRSG